jgi:SAM-dependent methyltransferase|tara:strand:- start:1548 stop:2381 length:834 start_codon:yes stop_codon:yes gene_type:complete
MTFKSEVTEGTRFEFGKNWSQFLRLLNEDRVNLAEESLCRLLEVDTLENKTFLDIGSGSGLYSLAARRLGAKVHSFDYDPQSVSCTTELKSRYFPEDGDWTIESGDALDQKYLNNLGKFDVVYSWGVLHHTGDMWNALHNASQLVDSNGFFYVSIYNDQGGRSKRMLKIKKIYNLIPNGLKWIIWMPMLIKLWWRNTLRDLIQDGKFFSTWRNYAQVEARGMSAFTDVIDWVGGLPFEVAKPEEIFDFFAERNFVLKRLKTCGGGIGCNEFVFKKLS